MRPNLRRVATSPFFLAAVLTLANAAKPAVVDDTAYLLFARHIAAQPTDPYGFELFWYRHPEPAMQILAPPVVPYWLAAGIALFGEELVLLKLWLFPFAAMFCWAACSLLRRFAHGEHRRGLLLMTLGPGLLPLFNFMLDVPAVALGLGAVALVIRGSDHRRFDAVVLAGALAGVAAQAKYTMLATPIVMLWYGCLHRRAWLAWVAVATSVGVFAAWELVLVEWYGVSHFAYHVRDQQSSNTSGGLKQVVAWVGGKTYLFTPLVGHVGGLACVWGLFAARGLGVERRRVAAMGVLATVGLIAVAVVPGEAGVLLRNRITGSVRLDLPGLVFLSLGYAVLGAAVASAGVLGFRPRRACGSVVRHDPASWFLVGWLAIEVAAYFALTPFPAARRVMMLCVLVGLIACRLVSRLGRADPTRRPESWITAFGMTCGFGLLAMDVWDALPERELASAASRMIGNRHGRDVWFQGHWGWQYYCDREGMKLIDPGRSRLQTGDRLVLPVLPDDQGFYRPYHGEAEFVVDRSAVELVDTLTWDDPLAFQTVPALYGGPVPFRGRDHPRLRVAIYHVTRDWTPMPPGRR